MEVTLETVAVQVADIAKQLTQLSDLKRQAQVYKEELKQEVKMAAEGYGATLKGIERELADLNKRFDTKFGDHDLVLTNHNKRITTLEEHR